MGGTPEDGNDRLHQSRHPPHGTAASTSETHGADISAVSFFILLDLWPLVLPRPHAHHLPALYSGLGSPRGETGEGRGGGCPAQREGVAPAGLGRHCPPPSQDPSPAGPSPASVPGAWPNGSRGVKALQLLQEVPTDGLIWPGGLTAQADSDPMGRAGVRGCALGQSRPTTGSGSNGRSLLGPQPLKGGTLVRPPRQLWDTWLGAL